MNVQRLRSTQVLVLLGLVGASAPSQAAVAAEPPADDGFAVEDESPPEGEGEDEGEVIQPSTDARGARGRGRGRGDPAFHHAAGR
jgi:hypothetical protein